MLELTDGEDGKVKKREEAKVTPGFFTYYSVEWGRGSGDEFTKREDWRGTACVGNQS